MITELYSKDVDSIKNKFYISKAKGTGGLVIIKADWCGHCRKTIPELYKVSQSTGDAFPVYKIDADKNKKLIEKMGIKGYPTIYFIDRAGLISSSSYNGERTSEKFLHEICKKARICY